MPPQLCYSLFKTPRKSHVGSNSMAFSMILPQKENRRFPKVGNKTKIESGDSRSGAEVKKITIKQRECKDDNNRREKKRGKKVGGRGPVTSLDM